MSLVKVESPIIPPSAWLARARAHGDRVGAYADAFVQRRSRGDKHPVHDFLFTYYPFSPNKLKHWVPALGEVLHVDETSLKVHPWLQELPFSHFNNNQMLDAERIAQATVRSANLVVQLCSAILERPPRFSCFGLHEWAMVYRQPAEQVRHQGYELRMHPQQLAAFVESQALHCTHYDAFRFFTPDARPLNAIRPTLETRVQNEQSGCLHANMDLYKWCSKLWPWCGGELLADTFLLALQGREMDMRASPYDLSHLGYEPIQIETPAGREQYRAEQQALQERAQPLRARVMAAAQSVIDAASGSQLNER